jgi:serine/threonine protein kinase
MVGNTIQGYEIQKCIKRGSISDVFLAKNQREKYAVIKVLRKDFWGKEEQLLFKKEADIMQQFPHSNIPRFYGYDEAQHALIMEYLEGQNLADYLKGLHNIKAEFVLKWALEILKTLHYLHQEGVIHTDIKPENLFLTKTSKVYLIDFGTAVITDIEEETNATQLLGEKTTKQWATHAYMSPEQSRQEVYLDDRTDIYSLGISCFELITGKKPFEAERTHNLVRQIREDNIPKHSELNSRLYEILLKATAKDPKDRYQKAIEFEAAIQQYLTPPAKPQKDLSSFWFVGAVVIILIAILFLFNPFADKEKNNISTESDSPSKPVNVVTNEIPKNSVATSKEATQKGGKVTTDAGNQKVVETNTTVTIPPQVNPSENVPPPAKVETEVKADELIQKYGSLLTALPEMKKLKDLGQREVAAIMCANAGLKAYNAGPNNYIDAFKYYKAAQDLNPSKRAEYQKKIQEIMEKSKTKTE